MHRTLSQLSLFAAIQLGHLAAGTVPPSPSAVDEFVDVMTERLARYECAKPRTDDDSWIAPVIAQDEALLGGMAELTQNRGRTFSLFDGESITTYYPGQVDQLYNEAFQFLIEVDCAVRRPHEPAELAILVSKLGTFSRGARAYEQKDDWRRRFVAA